MKTTLKTAIIILMAMTFYTSISAQVQGVNYWIKYNADSLWYDCYLIINNGSAAGNSIDAIQFNAQFSIVTTAGDSIQMVKSYYPKYDVNTPAPWSISTIVKSPLAQPQNDFYGIIPSIGGSPLASYIDGLNPGDTVKLFSIKRIGQTTLCGKELRIFENGNDAGPSEPGMASVDFSNGFTVGNPIQIYEGNSAQQSAINPTIVSAILSCSSGIEIDLTATAHSNQGPLNYLWTGPLGYTSTNEDVLIAPAAPANDGIYTIIVTDSIGCKDSLQVHGVSKPNAGPDQSVCANTSGHLIIGSPTSGTWSNISGNPAGATRTNVSPGVDAVSFNASASGSYKFKYSIGPSGTCADTIRFVVNPLPQITMSENSTCVGETKEKILVANAIGTWTSSNPSVATVTTVNSTTASVTGIAPGTVTFTFTRLSSGCTTITGEFSVLPSITIFPMSNICVGSIETIQPVLPGTWTSSNPTVATVTNAGVINTLSAGSTVITNINPNGCESSFTLNVLPKPIVTITGSDNICIGGTTTLSSNMAGTWASSNPLVATVTGNTATGVAEGSATFTFTALGGCTADPTSPVTVAPDPTASINDGRICDEQTAILTPASGGTWVSSAPLVATVSGNIATAVNNGTTTFTFTNALGCSDDVELIVDPKPIVSAAQDTMCVLAVNQLSPAIGGTWNNMTTSIVTYNNVNKKITGLSAGTAKLIFTESITGCMSDILNVEVEAGPTISFDPSPMCVGDTKQFNPTTGGVWASSNNGVLTIDNGGLATAIASGSAQVTYTSLASNCVSVPSTAIVVNHKPIINTLDNSIAINETTQFSSNASGGSWQSLNSDIATISSTGLVTGISKGKTFIKYNDAFNCESELFEIEVTGYKFVLTGFCFTDLNQNDIYDDGEDFPLSNCAITRTGSSIINYTDADGYFNFELDSAVNEVTYEINFGLWIENSITRTFNINKPVTYDFVGIKPSPNAGLSASVSLSSSAPLCNAFSSLNPIAFNESSTLLDGYLVIEYDDRTYFSETLPLPSGGSSNKLIWDFKDLAPGKMFSPTIKYFVPDEINSPDSLHFTAWILEKVTGDTLSTFDFSQEIICNTNAPNIVTVSWPDRAGEDNYTLNSETINYNIRYQNKGNGLARKVVIETVINEYLDENSLIIKESTFPYKASRNGKLLTIIMDSIELGSSREDEPGTLSYSFAIKTGTPDKTKIYHSARIAMDNGFEFTTNPVLNTVVSVLPCDLINDEVVQHESKLTINIPGNVYNWYDCSSNELLQSDSLSNFYPSSNGQYYVVVQGDNCKTASDCFEYYTTGTNDGNKMEVVVFPNPTTGLLNLEGLQEGSLVNLLNYRGENLMQCKCNQLNIANYVSGIYFLRVKLNAGIKLYKIVKN